jgi:DNA-binding CsgD family transcriptional regulator
MPVRPISPAIAPGVRSTSDQDERATVDQVLAKARDGVGGSLVLRGEPGSGKTSLLAHAVEHAAESCVAQSAGVQPEMELGFAALHGLLTPFLSHLDRLPGPQRDSLGAAFGLVAGTTPERFRIGLAVLTLLTEAAKDRPVLLAIDDAQWLDEATADVLAFVARRLITTPVAFVVAVREPTARVRSLDGLPSLHLTTIPQRQESASPESEPTSRLTTEYPTWCAPTTRPSPAGCRKAHRLGSSAGRYRSARPGSTASAAPVAGAAIDPLGAEGSAELRTQAWRRGTTEARSASVENRRDRTAAEPGADPALAQYALTILDLGYGRYQEALSRALEIIHDDRPGLDTQILPDLIEAAVRSGNRDAAASGLERLAERTHSIRTYLATGLLARSRALLTDDGEALYQLAIEHLQQADAGVDLARAHLLYGEWLRRQRRRRDAREQLRAAQELFEAIGFTAFAHRAAVELRATSEAVRKRSGDPDDELTPQEAEIARLVAEGWSNRQVAAQMFISQHTVDYHLRKVFRKIGVSSRTQLARAILDQSRGDETPAA